MTIRKKPQRRKTGKQRANMCDGFKRRFIGQFAERHLLRTRLTTIFWISLQIHELPVSSAGKDIG